MSRPGLESLRSSRVLGIAGEDRRMEVMERLGMLAAVCGTPEDHLCGSSIERKLPDRVVEALLAE
jgi:hypothetical protein